MVQRLALILGACLALLLPACGEEQAEKDEIVHPVRAVKIGDTESLIRRSLPGRAKATQEVNLSFRVSGSLISFPAQVGQEVAEGDLLVRLDPRDYEVNLRNVEGQLQHHRQWINLAGNLHKPRDQSSVGQLKGLCNILGSDP